MPITTPIAASAQIVAAEVNPLTETPLVDDRARAEETHAGNDLRAIRV
jgi:hypothetical protein